MAKEIKANVKQAFRQDGGRGIVRLSENILNKLGISPGDGVLIKGKKEAVALVWAVLDDEDNIIRMDGTLRYNAGVSIDEDVVLKPIELKNAKL